MLQFISVSFSKDLTCSFFIILFPRIRSVKFNTFSLRESYWSFYYWYFGESNKNGHKKIYIRVILWQGLRTRPTKESKGNNLYLVMPPQPTAGIIFKHCLKVYRNYHQRAEGVHVVAAAAGRPTTNHTRLTEAPQDIKAEVTHTPAFIFIQSFQLP